MKADNGASGNEPRTSSTRGGVGKEMCITGQQNSDLRTLAYRFAQFEVQPGEHVLLKDGIPLNLGRRAFDVLVVLIEMRLEVVAKEVLLDRVWPGLQVEEHNLAMQVSILRRLVGREKIATVPGRGYRFTAAVTCLDRASAGACSSAPVDRGCALPLNGQGVLVFGAIQWRADERAVLINGQRAKIGSRALDVLDVLVTERHRLVSKQEIMKRVWPGMVVDDNNLHVQISTLRKCLGEHSIATSPGLGYRFTLKLTKVDTSESSSRGFQPNGHPWVANIFHPVQPQGWVTEMITLPPELMTKVRAMVEKARGQWIARMKAGQSTAETSRK